MPFKSATTSHSRDAHHSVLIPAVLRSRSTTARNVPVVSGLCVPKGRLSNTVGGHVEGFDKDVAVQLDVLNRWSDGSVRWMLASFVAPDACSKGKETRVSAHAAQTGPIRTPQDSRSCGRLTTVKLVDDEICIISRDISIDPPTERTLRLSPSISDISGTRLPLEFTGIREEVCGSVRQVLVVSARIRSRPFITLQFRLSHWATAGLLQVETRIRNSRRARHVGGLWDLGDKGSFLFESLEVSVRDDDIPANATTHWKAEKTQQVRSTTAELFLRQFGSGDRFWSSPNHVTASGSSCVKNRGYEAISESGTLRGYRAEPAFLVEGDSANLALAVTEFWQQFPGSVASAMGSLEVGLFPAISGMTHELQGGEQKTQSFWLSAGSGSGDVDGLDWVYDSPQLLQSGVSITEAAVLPWFCAEENSDSRIRANSESEPAPAGPPATSALNLSVKYRLEQYLHAATSGRFSLQGRRASIDEYGWRNFGDVPADHEQTHYSGSNTIVSHYNNQFDMIFGGMLQFAATSDLKWFDLFDPLARHVMDIDIYHTSEDRAIFNGGMFWHTDHYVDARTCTHRTYSKYNQKPGQPYGGGLSCEHNYTTGLLHYYFLTGNPEARDSVLSLAEWVLQMEDGRNTVFGLLDTGPTGIATETVYPDYHGPGRASGNSTNALLDAWLLTGSAHYLVKLEELIRRCVHPSQNPDDLNLLDAEGHWSYTIFFNSLSRYLLAKREAKMFDAMYSYARDVMKTYGRWMAVNERRTLDRPEELEYPTEAWAAQDFRKANILRVAASCEDDDAQAAAMRRKADEISEAAWDDFAAFGEASLTARCLSITMTEGQREAFHRTCEPDRIPACATNWDFGPWAMYVSQRTRVRNLLKSPVGLLKAALPALSPSRILSTWRALRRRL